jgi:hypothetical protein
MSRRIWPVVALAALLAGGCAPGPQPTPEEPAAEAPETAEALERAGEYGRAAAAYARRAEAADGAEAARLRYRQGRALARAGRDVAALDVLEPLSGTEQADQAAVLRARIHLRNNRLETAVGVLDRLTERTGDAQPMPIPVREAALDYLAQARLAQGRPGAALDALVDRHRLLEGERGGDASIARIRYLLRTMPEQMLAERIEAVGEAFPGGYLRFERMMRQAVRQPLARTRTNMQEWLDRYPDHPLAAIVRDRLKRVQETPLRLAVLLPLDSRYAPVAEALLRGMLAAYYQTDHAAGIEVAILDTKGSATGAREALATVRDGDFHAAIGPLTRPAVGRLTEDAAGLPPVLALNTTRNWAQSADSLFQFGLDPEEEAAQAAAFAYRVGHRRAGVLFPETDWGRRMVAAFQERWAELGGSTQALQAFDPEERDHSAILKAFLQLDKVSERRRNLAATLDISLPEYETPPRREDLDFLFLASETLNARLIKPQLEFFAAGDLPVLATSHVHNPGDTRSDRRDMDGIRFLQLPWFLDPRPEHRRADQTIADSYPDQGDSLARLNAMGYDAYSLVVGAWRRSLILDDDLTTALARIRLEGGTGGLAADEDGRFQRRLQWAVYRYGRISPRPGMLAPGE